VNIFAKILSAFGIMPSKKQYEEWAETCGFFCTYIETRYPGHPVPVPPGDERTFYQACGFCLQMDSDGMTSFLEQPAAVRQEMERSLQQLGLDKLIALAAQAADALRQSGLTLGRKSNHSRISALMRPFAEKYYDELRDRAYARLYKFLSACQSFLPYALNLARMERDSGNPFDPKEWSAEKMAAL